MGNKIAILLVLLALAVGGYFAYQHFHEQKLDENGDVHCIGCMSPADKARFDRENSGETADGQSDRKTRTAAADDRAGFPDANATVNGTPGTAAGVTAQTSAPTPTYPSITATTTTPVTPANQAAPPAYPAAQPISSRGAGPVPTTDTELPNAPNGMRFTGTGTYQWYRQGNLTWRLDTTSGRSCIIYATMEEWQKQIVLEHSCGRSA